MAQEGSKKTNTGTALRPCTCYSEWQDKKYGKGIRIHNGCGGPGWRCTVCSTKK